MKTAPWHSKNPNIPVNQRVHHNDTTCTEGNNIESYYKQSGTGGYPLCNSCAKK